MVLVVDPDAAARERVIGAVEQIGCLGAACADGDAALARLDAGRTDAAVVASAPNGLDLVRRIKEARAGRALFPVMLVGSPDDDDIAGQLGRGFAAGCDDFLSGPPDLGELSLRLAALLRRREDARALDRKKRDLAALVVHDLRSPISTIAMAAELVRMAAGASPPDLEQVGELVGTIELSASKALSLVGGILDVEDLEAGMLRVRPSQVDVAALLDELSRTVRTDVADRHITLERQVAPDLSAVFDNGLVSRVLENLLYNAVRYAPRGGRVVVRATLDGGELVLAVGNNGPAVPPGDRERIFDRYYRIEARRAGARENRGLGLYFCRLAAEAHAGTIAIESEPELPAMFVLRIPQ